MLHGVRCKHWRVCGGGGRDVLNHRWLKGPNLRTDRLSWSSSSNGQEYNKDAQEGDGHVASVAGQDADVVDQQGLQFDLISGSSNMLQGRSDMIFMR